MTEKEKHRLAAEIVFTESRRPVYPSVEELMQRLSSYREALLTKNAALCRPFVKLFVTGGTLKSFGSVDFQYSLKPVEEPSEGVYFQMVRTMRLCL